MARKVTKAKPVKTKATKPAAVVKKKPMAAAAKATPPAKSDSKLAKKKPAAAPATLPAKTKSGKRSEAAPAAPVVKVKKPRAKKEPPKRRVRWRIYDGMMKPVADFDYKHKAAAEAKLADLLKNKPNYFIQLHKEAMPVTVAEESAPASKR